jgi:hypothetical protein
MMGCTSNQVTYTAYLNQQLVYYINSFHVISDLARIFYYEKTRGKKNIEKIKINEYL